MEAQDGGPYVAAVSVTAEANLISQTPVAAHPPWVRPLRDYERRESHGELQVSRYG